MAAPTFLDLVSGVITRKTAVETGPASGPAEQVVSTNTAGLIDASLLPSSGIALSVVSSENLAAGNLVDLYSNAGTLNVRKADGSTTGKPAHGYVLAATTTPASALVYTSGVNNQITGATVGEAYLSATPGAITNTPLTTAGQTSQRVGVALAATSMLFQPYAPITLT